MQPDAVGLGLAMGALALAIGLFGLASWLIAGTTSRLSYSVGAALSRGFAAWAEIRDRDPAAEESERTLDRDAGSHRVDAAVVWELLDPMDLAPVARARVDRDSRSGGPAAG